MPARIVGMIGVSPPKRESTLLVIEGELVPSFVVEFAQAHEAAGFDMALVGYSSSSAEGFLVAMHAAARTERMSYLIAHRPGFVAPTLFARKVATFDQLTGGRLALHIITGKTDAEQEGDGDFTPKVERYQRAQEYLHLMKRTWAADKPFDFDGRFYRVRGAHSDVRPLQKPHPLIMFGGASEGALEMGSAECDVFAIYAEPRATTAERVTAFRARAATHGRTVGFNMSVRPVIAATEGASMGQGKSHPCRHVGRAWLGSAGGYPGAGRQCRPAPVRLRARKGRSRRAALDGHHQGDRGARQYLLPRRHRRAGGRCDSRLLPSRRFIVPHTRLRSGQRHDRIRPRAHTAHQGRRIGDRQVCNARYAASVTDVSLSMLRQWFVTAQQ